MLQLDDPHVPACSKYFFLSRTYLKLEFSSDVYLLSKQNNSTYKNNSKNHTATDITSFFNFVFYFRFTISVKKTAKIITWHDYKFRATWLWFRATWLRARWLFLPVHEQTVTCVCDLTWLWNVCRIDRFVNGMLCVSYLLIIPWKRFILLENVELDFPARLYCG